VIGPVQLGSITTRIGFNPIFCSCCRNIIIDEEGGKQFTDEILDLEPISEPVSNPLIQFTPISKIDSKPEIELEVDLQTQISDHDILDVSDISDKQFSAMPVDRSVAIEQRLRIAYQLYLYQDELDFLALLLLVADEDEYCGC